MPQPIRIAYHDNSGQDDKRKWWQDGLSKRLGPCQLIPLTDKAALDCQFALVCHPPHGRLRALKQLKLIISLGQGVDHLMADPDLPEQAAIVRLVDPDMSHALSQWVILNVLDHLRDAAWRRDQRLADGVQVSVALPRALQHPARAMRFIPYDDRAVWEPRFLADDVSSGRLTRAHVLAGNNFVGSGRTAYGAQLHLCGRDCDNFIG